MAALNESEKNALKSLALDGLFSKIDGGKKKS